MPSTDGSLKARVGEIAGASAFLLYLAEAAGSHLTLNQAAFFMIAAAADARGKPLTRTQLLEAHGDQLRAALKHTYRSLMPASRSHPKGLGWLDRIDNPDDEREKFLVLSPKGREVVKAALLALAPLSRPNA